MLFDIEQVLQTVQRSQRGASAFGQILLRETPMETLAESKHLAKDKELNNQKWWAFDANNRTDSTVGNNLTVR